MFEEGGVKRGIIFSRLGIATRLGFGFGMGS